MMNALDLFKRLPHLDSDKYEIEERCPYVFDAIEEDVEETVEGDNNHPSVDLGLPSGLLWATCNVGASSPEQYGDYFAWGEIETKKENTEENSKTCGKPMTDVSGDTRYDVARARWGGRWRMPTKSELVELKNRCQWEWTTVNGVYGYKVTGPNGNSIFLPAAGCRDGSNLYYVGLDGGYWSSTPYEGIDDRYAFGLDFDDESQGMGLIYRYDGRSVRPVKDGKGGQQ